jgi:phage terminase large subunit-like protein
VSVVCGLVWAVEGVLTSQHYDGQSMNLEDGGNRFALNVLFFMLVCAGPPVALIIYAIGRTRISRVWATAVLVIPTVVWAAILARHISINHCIDPAAVG